MEVQCKNLLSYALIMVKLPWPDFRARHPTLVSIRMKSIFMKQNTHCADEHLKQMNSLKLFTCFSASIILFQQFFTSHEFIEDL